MKILYEDDCLLAVVKPPGMPSQPDKTGDEDLLGLLARVREAVYPVHRLDRPVGGVMVYGKTKQGANTPILRKAYRAVVCGTLPASGTLVHFLKKRERDNLSLVVPKGTKAAKEARLTYQNLGETPTEQGPLTLVEIVLETGRHHQIRVQMAAAGTPLWGDRKYNPAFARYRGPEPVALWSVALTVRHPLSGRKCTFLDLPDGFPFTLFDNPSTQS